MATAETRKNADASVASAKQNAKLEHTRGGVTTRDDATDLGVPMLAGDPKEPQGPEDALGVGAKRGDYTGRIGPENYQPHEVVAVEPPEDGVPVVNSDPLVRVEVQRPRAADIGDEKGVKGGTGTPE